MSLTIKVPSDTRRYTVNVVAQHTWKVGNTYTPSSRAYFAYRALTSVLPGQQNVINPTGNGGGGWPDDNPSSSTGDVKPPHPNDNANADTSPTLDKVVLAFAIGVPLMVAICAALLFLHVKNQRQAMGIGIELNERFDGSSASSSSSTRPNERFNRLHEDNQDTGAYVPPGQAAYVPPGQQQYGRESQHQHVDTQSHGAGGDYGGMSSAQAHDSSAAGGWHQGSAMSHYAQQAGGQEHEQISGRGFYEL